MKKTKNDIVNPFPKVPDYGLCAKTDRLIRVVEELYSTFLGLEDEEFDTPDGIYSLNPDIIEVLRRMVHQVNSIHGEQLIVPRKGGKG